MSSVYNVELTRLLLSGAPLNSLSLRNTIPSAPVTSTLLVNQDGFLDLLHSGSIGFTSANGGMKGFCSLDKVAFEIAKVLDLLQELLVFCTTLRRDTDKTGDVDYRRV